jgi:hypothetical protein
MTLRRLVSTLVVAVALSPACISTQVSYNRKDPAGSDLPQLVERAVELQQESDQQAVVQAGGVLLGDLEIVDKTHANMFKGSRGGHELADRAAVEAAHHGGTHIYLTASNRNREAVGNVESATAHFSVYRVERAAWPKLDAASRPDGSAR